MPRAAGQGHRPLHPDAGETRLFQLERHRSPLVSLRPGRATARGRVAWTPSAARRRSSPSTSTYRPANAAMSSRCATASAALPAASWARMIVNSPCATSAAPALSPWRGVKPPRRPASMPTPTLPTSVAATAKQHDPADLARPCRESIVSANAKKNSAANTSRSAKNRCSISSRTPLSERIDARHQRADRLGHVELASRSRSSRSRTRTRRAGRTRARAGRAAGRSAPRASARRRAPRRRSTSAFAVTPAVDADAPAARRDEAEHGGDRDVLEEQDREHEVGLVVGQATEVAQRLDCDRARRHVDARRDDDRREAEPERRDADERARARR